MKAFLRLVIFAALLAGSTFLTHPTSARVQASKLQLSANGRQGTVVNRAGCTRITNRFCTQSTRSNCSACL